jgi:hypothetical protein
MREALVRHDAIGMSVEMTAGVLTANLLEGMKFDWSDHCDEEGFHRENQRLSFNR